MQVSENFPVQPWYINTSSTVRSLSSSNSPFFSQALVQLDFLTATHCKSGPKAPWDHTWPPSTINPPACTKTQANRRLTQSSTCLLTSNTLYRSWRPSCLQPPPSQIVSSSITTPTVSLFEVPIPFTNRFQDNKDTTSSTIGFTSSPLLG